MRARIPCMLVLVVLTASPLSGQMDISDVGDDPVEVLLDLRRQLDLTETQVSSLREIQRTLRETNRPLIEEIFAVQRQVKSQLVEANPQTRRRPARPTESQLAAARVPMEKIQANNLAAMEAVNGLLTEEQKRRAAALLRIQDRRSERGDWFRWPGRRFR
jgi:uncharacterized membrane protein